MSDSDRTIDYALYIQRLETAIENIAFRARPFSSGEVAKKILEKDSRSKNLFAINKAIWDLSSAIRRARCMVVDWQDTHAEEPSGCSAVSDLQEYLLDRADADNSLRLVFGLMEVMQDLLAQAEMTNKGGDACGSDA